MDDYNNRNIEVRVPPIDVSINPCNSDQITIYYKKKLFYCVMPVCVDNCSDHTRCTKPYEDIHVNDKNLNVCECLPGWKGENCDEEDIVDFSQLNILIKIMVFTVIFIVSLYLLFLIGHRKQGIINDVGQSKLILFSVGIIMYFLSNLFSTYMNYTGCSIHFFLRHIGLSIVISVFYTIIDTNLELGIKPNFHSQNLTFTFNSNEDVSTISALNDTTIIGDKIVAINGKSKKGKDEGFRNNLSKIIKTSQLHKDKRISTFTDKSVHNMEVELNELVIKKIRKIRNTLLLVNSGIDGKFYYKCDLKRQDLVLNCVEFIFFLLILFKSNDLNNYNDIYICTKYINYCIKIGIFCGPLINVNIL
ncbi:hypothetical protein PIROE2DRAFT_9316 [Piromyces sp. E2]|nr:hypothetical protein PIROE2DRAFT_9316 [Piromyces sp. E2]|eukprot:OUM64014.1 hypothetical protein PIROE2DRAFT_9316 [Piromyces sp. E2]